MTTAMPSASTAANTAANTIIVGGAQLTLLPQRAVLWRRRHMLIVADIHFGKAAAFRAAGIPVPRGTTQQNLDLLDQLIAAHGIRQIVFLGDFLHARTSHAPATIAALLRWRTRQTQLKLILVRGNHDMHAGDPPEALYIEVVNEPYTVGGLALCHHPQQVPQAYVLAGHVHPVFRLAVGRESLRLPCFIFDTHCATLPAFGAFTGGHMVNRQPGRRIFIAADDVVFAIGNPSI